MQTIPARWFHQGRLKAIRLIVLHCTVSPESGTGAEAVARYFARGERRASAHRVADNNSTVLCVQDQDTAFAAAGANSDGIHLELVGMPDQTEMQWLDEFSKAMLFQGGLTIREWSREYGIPLRWLTVAQVRDGKTKGLCTHADVSLAFPAVSTGHYDPGPHFPKSQALGIWTPQHEPPPAAPPEDDDMIRFVKVGTDVMGAMVWHDGRIFDRDNDRYARDKGALYAVFHEGAANQREVDLAQSFVNDVVLK